MRYCPSLPCFATSRALNATSFGTEGKSAESELQILIDITEGKLLVVRFKYQSGSKFRNSIFPYMLFHSLIPKPCHSMFDHLFLVTILYKVTSRLCNSISRPVQAGADFE